MTKTLTKSSKDLIPEAGFGIFATKMPTGAVFGNVYQSVEETSQKEPGQWDVKGRLQELKSLENGWYDGVQGCRLSEDGIDWLSMSWYRFYPPSYHVRLPYLFPTIEGNIQAEWTFGHREIIFTIDIINQRGRWHSMDMEAPSDENDEERELDLKQPEEWNWIFKQISDFQKEQV